ncbi:MAG: hypothetical protein D6721_04080 [Gammaproteobacteria bacterium]|nr:MAG: hypothetical protein D6721_04080 [Gammaproteobacteria bacterium]
MIRRLYVLFPDRAHALAACRTLETLGVPRRRMHALAREGVALDGLPAATAAQREDRLTRVEQGLWYGNLVLFFLVLGVTVLMALQGHWIATLVGVLLMLASYLAGEWFATRVIGVHAREFADALRHGEILLLVDVPVHRLREVEHQLHRRHPEAVIGGSGWAIEALGM